MPVHLQGASKTLRMLKQLQRRHKSLRPFLTAEASKMAAVIAQSWSRREGPDGSPWAPYKDPSRTGGSLRHRQRIKATSKRLSVRGDHITAFAWYGTSKMPPRNPSPIIRFAGITGPEGHWARRHGDRLKRYVLTGQAGGR